MHILCDDLFISNKLRIKELIILLKKAKIKINFSLMGVRANLIDKDLITDLVKLGVIHVNIGLESGSDKILKKLKDKVTLSDNLRAIKLLNNAGITSYCMFMLGHPEETIEDLKSTLKLIKNPFVRNGEIFITTPMPKTQLWFDCGFGEDISDWENFDFKQGYKKNICKYLTKKQLHFYQKKATKIISRKKIIDKIKKDLINLTKNLIQK